MEVAGHVVRVLHVDGRRGVLNRQIPGHRVAGLGNAARQINVDSRIASSVRPGTIYRAKPGVLAASRATQKDFETGSAAWPSSGKASGP